MPRCLRPAVAALLLVAACSDTTEPTAAAVAGRYALQSVAGHSLPAAVQATSIVTTVQRSALTLNADGSCVDAGHYVRTYGVSGRPPLEYDESTPCTWAVRGGTVVLTYQTGAGPSPISAAFGGNALTVGADLPPNGYAIYPRVYTK